MVKYAMRVLFKDGISVGQMMERKCEDIKDIQQKVGTVWQCWEMPLSHCWRSALSEIHICLPETSEASLRKHNQKMNLFLKLV